MAGEDPGAAGSQPRRDPTGHGGEIGDAGLGDRKRGDPHDRRLDFTDAVRIEPAQSRKAVRPAPPLEFVEGRKFGRVGGHHHFPGASERDALLLAQPVHRFSPLDAQPRFERTGAVVEPGMDHAAVVAALVGGDRLLLLQDHDRDPGVGLDDGAGHPEADESGSHDAEVVAVR